MLLANLSLPLTAPYTLSQCGDPTETCSIRYTVAQVGWAPEIRTTYVMGNAAQISASSSFISFEFMSQSTLNMVVGAPYIRTDWRAPGFTATCCDDSYHIESGVTAHVKTALLPQLNATASVCTESDVIFTGSAVGIAHATPITELPFLEHDCDVSTPVIQKAILTRVTIMQRPPNPPTNTNGGQSTWWEDGSNTVTIKLPVTPTRKSDGSQLTRSLRFISLVSIRKI